MTPEEKAIELFDSFYYIVWSKDLSISCAITTVEEILKHIPSDYWKEVKYEILKF